MKHLKHVNMSYFNHMKFALSCSFQLCIAVILLTIHAFVPCWFEKLGSKFVAVVHERMQHVSDLTKV